MGVQLADQELDLDLLPSQKSQKLEKHSTVKITFISKIYNSILRRKKLERSGTKTEATDSVPMDAKDIKVAMAHVDLAKEGIANVSSKADLVVVDRIDARVTVDAQNSKSLTISVVYNDFSISALILLFRFC